MTGRKCYWITYTSRSGNRWDEGTPYAANDEDDAERQMIVNGCGGDPSMNLDELRAHYRRYFESDDREAADYEIYEAGGWDVGSDGFPEQSAKE